MNPIKLDPYKRAALKKTVERIVPLSSDGTLPAPESIIVLPPEPTAPIIAPRRPAQPVQPLKPVDLAQTPAPRRQPATPLTPAPRREPRVLHAPQTGKAVDSVGRTDNANNADNGNANG